MDKKPFSFYVLLEKSSVDDFLKEDNQNNMVISRIKIIFSTKLNFNIETYNKIKKIYEDCEKAFNDDKEIILDEKFGPMEVLDMGILGLENISHIN